MHVNGSKNHAAVGSQGEARSPQSNVTPGWRPPEGAEFVSALGTVVSAFVDLGFGASAAHLAKRAANDNRRLFAIASEFHRKID